MTFPMMRIDYHLTLDSDHVDSLINHTLDDHDYNADPLRHYTEIIIYNESGTQNTE